MRDPASCVPGRAGCVAFPGSGEVGLGGFARVGRGTVSLHVVEPSEQEALELCAPPTPTPSAERRPRGEQSPESPRGAPAFPRTAARGGGAGSALTLPQASALARLGRTFHSGPSPRTSPLSPFPEQRGEPGGRGERRVPGASESLLCASPGTFNGSRMANPSPDPPLSLKDAPVAGRPPAPFVVTRERPLPSQRGLCRGGCAPEGRPSSAPRSRFPSLGSQGGGSSSGTSPPLPPQTPA